MNIFVSIVITTLLIIDPLLADDVCINQRCKCPQGSTIVNCDTKGWKNLDGIDFPPKTTVLTLVNNNLKFDTINDRSKIQNLLYLTILSINQNPLGIIPPFNNTKMQSLLLQDTSLTSTEFPSSYSNSILQTISLSNNKIRSIKENDFTMLRNSQLKSLTINGASISMIDQNAFVPLNQLQSLSLNDNQLKSCDFLPSLRLLSSIKFDGNQFTSLPQLLTSPGNIKVYSFKQNSISIIDESSPLHTWITMNYTNIKIYLADNPFDCCQSLWFIRLLKSSSKFIDDASLLTCLTPSDFAGKQLIKLDPDQMNCGGDVPSKPWWTTGRIVAVLVGSIITVAIGVIVIISISLFFRRHRSRSGYTEIDGVDDPYPNVPSLPSGGPAFETAEDNEDAYSTVTFPDSIRSTIRSEAPTHTTAEGTDAVDVSLAGDHQLYEAALIPSTH